MENDTTKSVLVAALVALVKQPHINRAAFASDLQNALEAIDPHAANSDLFLMLTGYLDAPQ